MSRSRRDIKGMKQQSRYHSAASVKSVKSLTPPKQNTPHGVSRTNDNLDNQDNRPGRYVSTVEVIDGQRIQPWRQPDNSALFDRLEEKMPEDVRKPEQYRHGTRYGFIPGDTDPLVINEYDPARDVACQICGVPYGTVATPNDNELRSHEILLDSRDHSVFLLPLVRVADRSTYSGYIRMKAEKRQRRIERENEDIRRAVEEAEALGAFA